MSGPGRIVLHGCQVIDGTGAAPAAADVVIEDGIIVDVGRGLDGDEGVDVSGLTVMPGFIDCHVHTVFSGVDQQRMLQEPFSYQFYAAARNMALTLDTGVTTVRDAGGADLGMKQAVADGLIEGPRLLTAITVLGQTGGHTDGWCASGGCVPLLQPHPGRPGMIVDGPDEMRRRVRELVRAGADTIKICTSGGVISPRDDPRHAHFSAEELDICVAEATAAGLDVMAHAQGAQGVKNAIRAGVHSIEHGVFLDDEAIDLLVETGTWLVPTLMASHALLGAAAAGTRLPPVVLDKARAAADQHQISIARAVDAGVRIAMGTDSGVFPHGDNLDELDFLHTAGMTPLGALTSGTSAAAQLLGIGDTVGTVQPGKLADLVCVEGDPLDLVGYRKKITQVWQRGHRRR
ncbi:amidohydrolase family protein [Rhodococcus sp. NPDC127530]|uniref:metal-dependent hydrolase family protein n=1 Tax=unclassified Rhodococcus (in: high G+C Gram-positive bacteria) TaxID=192944 RepID=UPI0036305F69